MSEREEKSTGNLSGTTPGNTERGPPFLLGMASPTVQRNQFLSFTEMVPEGKKTFARSLARLSAFPHRRGVNPLWCLPKIPSHLPGPESWRPS